MAKPHGGHRRPSNRTNLASCAVATVFLLFLLAVFLIVYFTVFKPKDPKISVNAVQLPSFAVSNNTANFTFSQYVAIRNPNRAAFSHYDSSIQLLYSGNRVGFMFIPAGKIESGRTQYMAATFTVQSFPISPSSSSSNIATVSAAVVPDSPAMPGPPDFTVTPVGDGYANPGYGYASRVGPTMEIESRMELAGRVKVLNVLTHHVVAKSDCRVTVSIVDGSVLGFHC
ncbi:BnaA09g12240D [Brassica napus]|uniref:BnaA09g12240D protein n=1 Tax=Brassica napus TaxID=3708 RepID=A0A078IAC5_BRANA|nr:BnaA09g12240D [Brassica napus]